MSANISPVYFNPLQTNCFKHVYGILQQLQIQASSSGVVMKKKTRFEEFIKIIGKELGKTKFKLMPELIERYKQGTLTFNEFMESLCTLNNFRNREYAKGYALCYEFYFEHVETKLVDVNQILIIRKGHLFIYWLVFCAVDLNCTCELDAEKVCELLGFLCESSFKEVPSGIFSSLHRANKSYDFVTFIQILFSNCLKTLNDSLKGELARRLYDRFVKGVIISGFLMRQQIVGPIKSYVKRLHKLTPTKLEVYEIGKNNEQRIKGEIILNQHSQIAMIIKDFDPMKFYFQVTCGFTQTISKMFAEDEITRFKWITEMKRVIKYHIEGNISYHVDVGSGQPQNPANLLYQIPDPKLLPVLRDKDMNFETIEDTDDDSISQVSVNTSISQEMIRKSLVDEIIEETLYNQMPSNKPIISLISQDESVDLDYNMQRSHSADGEPTFIPFKSTLVVTETLYMNIPPPILPAKKLITQSYWTDVQTNTSQVKERPVAAPRRVTIRESTNSTQPPTSIQKKDPTPISTTTPTHTPTTTNPTPTPPTTTPTPTPTPTTTTTTTTPTSTPTPTPPTPTPTPTPTPPTTTTPAPTTIIIQKKDPTPPQPMPRPRRKLTTDANATNIEPTKDQTTTNKASTEIIKTTELTFEMPQAENSIVNTLITADALKIDDLDLPPVKIQDLIPPPPPRESGIENTTATTANENIDATKANSWKWW